MAKILTDHWHLYPPPPAHPDPLSRPRVEPKFLNLKVNEVMPAENCDVCVWREDCDPLWYTVGVYCLIRKILAMYKHSTVCFFTVWIRRRMVSSRWLCLRPFSTWKFFYNFCATQNLQATCKIKIRTFACKNSPVYIIQSLPTHCLSNIASQD